MAMRAPDLASSHLPPISMPFGLAAFACGLLWVAVVDMLCFHAVFWEARSLARTVRGDKPDPAGTAMRMAETNSSAVASNIHAFRPHLRLSGLWRPRHRIRGRLTKVQPKRCLPESRFQ